MCFVKKLKNPLTASEDIEVYKVFRKVVSYFNKPEYYTGPYKMDFIYENVNGEYTCNDFGKEIESGCVGFHSFKNFNDAVRLMDNCNMWALDHESYEIIPCIIPKGTKYYEGYFFNSQETYVSEKIQLNY